MTDFEKFIQQFDNHVNDIVEYNYRSIEKLKQPLLLGFNEDGSPKYSILWQSYRRIYECTGFATKDALEELAKISFIDLTVDMNYNSIIKNNGINEPYVGMEIFYSHESDYKNIGLIKTNHPIHAAALYECTKRYIYKLNAMMSDQNKISIIEKIDVLKNVMDVFEYWAEMKGIAVENNFYHKQNVKQIQDTNQIPKKYTIRYGDSFFATEDFTEVKHNSNTYIFTRIQSKAIMFMFYEQTDNGNCRISGEDIVNATDSDQLYLSSIFKGNAGWMTLVIKVGQSYYKLDIINIKE